ncbi:MAG: tetratricopeptide repeat protein [Phycisphaerae bacterium]|nr:tetratricopeptide repeat protein [Phycisphaerae bacterium]
MLKARSQLWLTALLFAVLGMVIALAYHYFRAGNIQQAEGRREYDAGRFDLAEVAFSRATQANPANGDAWYWLGLSRKNQGRVGPAAEALAKATSLEPDRVAWWIEYAEALQWAQQFAKAEEAWNEVIRLLPPDDARRVHTHIQLARALGGQQATDRAITVLENLLTQKDTPQVRFALAEVLAWGGRLEESAQQYRRALDTQPEN